MIANSASFVARSTKILIISKCSISAFACHQVCSLYPSTHKSLVLISNKYLFIITKVTVLARVGIFTITATIVTL